MFGTGRAVTFVMILVGSLPLARTLAAAESEELVSAAPECGETSFALNGGLSGFEEPYSPSMAVMLPTMVTFGLTAGGIALPGVDAPEVGVTVMLAGMVFGPSVGHFYLGDWDSALLFSAGRGAALGLAIWGISESFCLFDECEEKPEATAMVVGGMLSYLGLMVWEIVASGVRADELNQEARREYVSIAPFVAPSVSGDGNPFVGLGLAMEF